MNQSEARDAMEAIIVNNGVKVKEVLLTSLDLPLPILGAPTELRGYVNGQRLSNFIFADDFVIRTTGSGSFSPVSPQQSAAFGPYPPSIFVNTNELQRDSERSGINEAALLEILLNHELVHMWMMSRFVKNSDSAWIKSHDVRFIHESVALRACEFAFPELYENVRTEDTQKYLVYVEEQARLVGDGFHYSPYFTRYRGVESHKFWSELIANSPIELDFS